MIKDYFKRTKQFAKLFVILNSLFQVQLDPFIRFGKQIQRLIDGQKTKNIFLGFVLLLPLILVCFPCNRQIMKNMDIEVQLKNYKIRAGYLMKRSRVLREWRKRWMVLTMNYLFSFESEGCQKATQVIDLKEVISLKSFLRKPEEGETNCLYIQTKSIDFAFSAKQSNEKWSWIVTLERLFDFKQKGASSYNNIDQIRTQGFQSQNQYQLLQKSKFKSNRKIINSPDKEKSQNLQVETNNNLLELQDSLKKKEEQLTKKEKKLKKVELVSAECLDLAENFTQKIRTLEKELKEFRGLKVPKIQQMCELKPEKDTSPQNEISLIKPQKRQSIEENRQKCITYLLDEFKTCQNRSQLLSITNFFMVLSMSNDRGFYKTIGDCLTFHNHASNFVKLYLQEVMKNRIKDHTAQKRMINMLKLIFKAQNNLQKSYFEQTETVLLNWCQNYSKQTPFELLTEMVSLLTVVLQKTKGERSEEAKNILTNLSELSEDLQYRKKCMLALNFIRRSSSDNITKP